MIRPLSVSMAHRDRIVRSIGELRDVLSTADARGGCDFWLTSPGWAFPCLAVRTSAGQADVHYFRDGDHAGFRRLAEPAGTGETLFRFDGCDPCPGELVPGEFVVSLAEALAIAEHFMHEDGLAEPSRWFEL